MTRFLSLAIAGLIMALCLPAPQAVAAGSSVLGVAVDHARILKIDRPAATVIIGNPAIVDIEVLSSDRLVLTGKSYGITNVVILDSDGNAILDQQVAVQTFEDSTVRVYRQASRTTFACAPKCEPTITIGDDPEAFAKALTQYQQRQQMATEAAKH
ncbi:pilus assembly protein N-terminal domain-containing protein [Aurantimonas sp. VKM B-3413]|uniref:pilus assembly protein N-terminal domain-containing protein n=1 Tax=Aurantimonas sp. VKM B-3413 TaxID=2779401 RepID=UPI001E3D330C|nr:pilus assembly protein N-terminal domain-containing protein [Aurantimonas sp. VKM B-3413]MCB8836821.1 pilus assembly protein N-terminal domain-containing protein [Aurantimonas sp. VKM B-3413]